MERKQRKRKPHHGLSSDERRWTATCHAMPSHYGFSTIHTVTSITPRNKSIRISVAVFLFSLLVARCSLLLVRLSLFCSQSDGRAIYIFFFVETNNVRGRRLPSTSSSFIQSASNKLDWLLALCKLPTQFHCQYATCHTAMCIAQQQQYANNSTFHAHTCTWNSANRTCSSLFELLLADQTTFCIRCNAYLILNITIFHKITSNFEEWLPRRTGWMADWLPGPVARWQTWYRALWCARILACMMAHDVFMIM